ncbi:MAG: gliding motility-associated C-terminal domain-containing protein, partial [Saprospiraceae bacterium]|nr:gliding motility-associated C-terminal domain-containing protein [Saprospiraceae bacterium]
HMNDGFVVAARANTTDLALIRFNSAGSILWAKRYRATAAVRWVSVDADATGNLVLGGYAESSLRGLLLKINAQGDVVWSRVLSSSATIGRACATQDGGAFQISTQQGALRWRADGNLEWSIKVTTTSPMGIANMQPAEVSDGFLLPVRLSFDYLHLTKIDKDGHFQWVSPSFPTDNAGTADILLGVHPQRILPFRGDSALVVAYFSKDGNTYVALHVLSPGGQVVFQNLLQPSPDMKAQDYDISSNGLSVVGWNNNGVALLRLTNGLVLGCGDFQKPKLLEPNILVSVEKEPLPAVENWPIAVRDLSIQSQSFPLYSPTFYCQTNDTAAADLVHKRPTCLGEVVYLRPEAPEGAVITWADGRRDTVFRAEGPGTYSAQIAYCGLNWRVEYSLEARDCACEPIYPTAFTPDGDGTNDAFGPIAVPECAYAAFEWAVFNRWGERLFASSSPADAWNGRRPDGQAAPSDVYVWQLRYALLNGSERVWFVKKGDVTLMR